MRRRRRRGPSTQATPKTQDAKSLLIRDCKAGDVLPIISNTFIHNHLFRQIQRLTETTSAENATPHQILRSFWADEVQFNLHGPRDFAAASQYHLVMTNQSDRQVKQHYLRFIGSILDDLVEDDLYDIVSADLNSEYWTFTQKAEKYEDEGGATLGFEQGRENALLQLADLNLPIYLTTSCHSLIETALRRANKAPVTDFFRWNAALRFNQSQLEAAYEPSAQRPLVYHLHGIDSEPHSLVLTEEDHLEFLIALRQDRDTFFPIAVQEALITQPLLMLGYQPEAWDFKILFHGLIQNRQKKPKSVCVQVTGTKTNTRYVENYLRQADFEVIWDDTFHFLKELWQGVKAS